MTMSGNSNNPKLRGVIHNNPTGPSDGQRARPRTVQQIIPLEQYAIQYVSAEGVVVTNVLVKVGDRFYLPPNGSDWAANLRPAAPWLIDEIKRFGLGTTQSVDGGGVDVLPGADDAEDSTSQ